jgi:hypothetical protein
MLAAALTAAPAHAQNSRSFVSGHGSDAAPCTLAAPCRTFAHAITVTNPGGELDVLDAAGYGSLTIDRAISIVNDGVGTAGVIVPSGGVGITINAGASDAVSLRGLSVEGGGVGAEGIHFNTGASLTVENCVIRHIKFTSFPSGTAINFFPNASSSLSVSNSLLADNGIAGVNLQPPGGSGTITAVLDRVQLKNNGLDGLVVNGQYATGTINAAVYDSVSAGNSDSGFAAYSDTGAAPTTLMLFHSVSANNGTGLFAQGVGATLRVAHSMVTENGNGWRAFGTAVILSDGDNTIEGNTSNETAPGTYARK